MESFRPLEETGISRIVYPLDLRLPNIQFHFFRNGIGYSVISDPMDTPCLRVLIFTGNTGSNTVCISHTSSGTCNLVTSRLAGNNVAVSLGSSSGTFIASNTLFINNAISINANNAQTSTMQVTQCQFSGTFPSPSSSLGNILCSTTTTVVQSDNLFCGANATVLSCQNWLTTNATYSDGCGVCLGDNSEKDCSGVCWGTSTNCVNKSMWSWWTTFEISELILVVYVAVGGNGNGLSASSPLGNIQQAINMTSYGDIVELAPGTYCNVDENFWLFSWGNDVRRFLKKTIRNFHPFSVDFSHILKRSPQDFRSLARALRSKKRPLVNHSIPSSHVLPPNWSPSLLLWTVKVLIPKLSVLRFKIVKRLQFRWFQQG